MVHTLLPILTEVTQPNLTEQILKSDKESLKLIDL